MTSKPPHNDPDRLAQRLQDHYAASGPDPRFADELERRLVEAMPPAHTARTHHPISPSRRSRMMNRTLAVAASLALVLLLGGLLSWLWPGTEFRSIAFAEAVEKARQHDTVRYTMVFTAEGKPPQEKIYYYKAPHHIRIEDRGQYVAVARPGETLHLYPHENRAELLVDARTRRLTIDPATGEVELVDQEPEAPADLVQFLLELKDDALIGEQLGERQIDGRQAVGFRFEDDRSQVTTVWVDVETELPIRVERTLNGHRWVYRDIGFGADLDQSLFSLKPPAGYELTRDVLENPEPPQRPDQQSLFKARHIATAIIQHAQRHGEWPDDLAALRDAGVSDAVLVNPARPDQTPGYVYHKPQRSLEELGYAPDVVLVHGAYDQWPERVAAGFADGHASLIESEEELRKLVERGKTSEQEQVP